MLELNVNHTNDEFLWKSMETQELIILKYQDNFADNFTSIAYGKILEKISNRKCCFENTTSKRATFENKMTNFNAKIDYISSARINKITQESYFLTRLLIDEKNIQKELKKKKAKNNIIDLKYFKIDDIKYLTPEIKKLFEFENLEFIKNYDILENIQNSQSIGLYLNKDDIENNKIDYDFIYNATKRLNKYIKKPKLYVFTNIEIENKFNSFIDYKIINIKDWREEFYFLSNCKHNIIPNTNNSYSTNFWASQINTKSYSIIAYDKKTKATAKNKTFIAI